MSAREKFYRDLLDNLNDGIYFTDAQRRITYWNKGAERLTGYSSQEVLGKRCSENLLVHMDRSGRLLCLGDCPLSSCINGGKSCEAEVYLHHKDGHRVPVYVRTSPITDDSGAITGVVEIFNNNSAKVQLEIRLEEIQQLALVDALTGLPNRRHLESQITSRLEELKRNSWAFGILFIDIDRFKKINDIHGHDLGDKALRMVGKTLYDNLRQFDMVGRWGGEEFLAVVTNTHFRDLREVGERMRLLVEHSGLFEPQEIRVTVSIGCAEAAIDDSIATLVRRADDRLYEAKRAGRNRVSY